MTLFLCIHRIVRSIESQPLDVHRVSLPAQYFPRDTRPDELRDAIRARRTHQRRIFRDSLRVDRLQDWYAVP